MAVDRTSSRLTLLRTVVTVLLVGASLVGPGLPPAQAAPLVTGNVINDANGNGAVDSALGTGAEVGLAGATVELVASPGGAVLDSTTSGADGSFVLDAGSDVPVFVRVRAPSGWAVNGPGDGGAGDISRVDPVTGESAPFQAGTGGGLQALLRPDFAVTLGFLNNPDGILTGAGPFDTDPACSPDPGVPTTPQVLVEATYPPGVDCYAYDDNVRSADVVAFNFGISGSSKDDTVPSVSDLVIRQTLTPTGGAILNFARIPLVCTPGGGGGTAGPTSAVEYFDGTNWVEYAGASTGYAVPVDVPAAAIGQPVRFTCNKGLYSTGDAATLGTTVRVDGVSPEGSSFGSETIAFAVNAGVATAVAAGPVTAPTIKIKARPTWDLRKGGFYRQLFGSRDPDGAGPLLPVDGFYTYFNVMIGSDRAVGNEPLVQPISIQDQMYFFQTDGTPVALVAGVDFIFDDCFDYWPQARSNQFNNVISNVSRVAGRFTEDMAVRDSGTCTVSNDGLIEWSGIDFGGPYPTQTVRGQSLVAGPYLVANKWIQVFIPATTLDNRFGGTPNDDTGSGSFWNRVVDFDPDGISGTSNFDAAREPGWCDPAAVPTTTDTGCDSLPQPDQLYGNTRSNNVIGPTVFQFTAGTFGKYLVKPNGGPNTFAAHDDMAAIAHLGDGTIQAGGYTSTYIPWAANGSSYENPTMCDVFDGTVARLAPLAESNTDPTGTSPSPYATTVGVNTDTALLTYEYAAIPIAGDDPLANGYNSATGRYEGNWAGQAAANCDQAGVVWESDPNNVVGGIDAVNAVRVSGPGSDDATPLSPTMSPGSGRVPTMAIPSCRARFWPTTPSSSHPTRTAGPTAERRTNPRRRTAPGMAIV